MRKRFGIIYQNINGLVPQIHQLANNNDLLKNRDTKNFFSFSDFTKVFFKAIKARNSINTEKTEFNLKDFPSLNIKYNIKTYCNWINDDLLTYLVDGNKEIILFGAGGAGIKVIEFIQEIGSQINKDIKILMLFDNDPNKWGTKLMSYEIKQPSLADCERADKIIIASKWANDIKIQLMKMGVKEEKY